jgi:hypothetical protein
MRTPQRYGPAFAGAPGMNELARSEMANYASMCWTELSRSGVASCEIGLDLLHGEVDCYRASLRLDEGPTVLSIDTNPYIALRNAIDSATGAAEGSGTWA